MKRNYFEKIHRNEFTLKRDSKTTLIFKILKTYQKKTLKEPRIFLLQQHIKRTMSKLRQFFINRNYNEKVHRNDVDYSSIEINSKKYIKMTWKFVNINVST